MSNGSKSSFVVVINGQITTANFPEQESLWLRYGFVAGPDWTVVAGETEGLSAACYKTPCRPFVIDLSFSVTYRSTNPFRWPRLVITCYGKDFFGNDVVKGYGMFTLPTTPGRHNLESACATPEASTSFQNILGMIWGRRPELVDPNIMALSEGREVLRMSTEGLVNATFEVLHKDLKKSGFDWDFSSMRTPSIAPLPDFEPFQESRLEAASLGASLGASLAVPSARFTSHSDLLSPTVEVEREESGASGEDEWRPQVQETQETRVSRPLPQPLP
ncbi:unnamed protein product, partial [Mesorhabditis belari]|uniref:B9 domain-containing protein 1 n=1 Tax=Mesorhabditis belari TaxID=2138241 RepID=A0AAF3FLQ1_9BILA